MNSVNSQNGIINLQIALVGHYFDNEYYGAIRLRAELKVVIQRELVLIYLTNLTSSGH